MSDSTKSPNAVIMAYALATQTRNIALLKEIFHEDAVMTGWLGPDFLHGSPEPFYAALEANEVSDTYASRTVRIEESGRVAIAETHEIDLFGMSFQNDFHMVQVEDGRWQLTSKLFSHA